MTSTQVPRIFDRDQARAKWARARDRLAHGGTSYLTDSLADDIIDRLDFMRFEPTAGRVVGDVSHRLSHHLIKQGASGEYAKLGEFDEEGSDCVLGKLGFYFHLLGLGAVNDLPGALIRARNELKDGGLFIAAFPGSGSMPILRQIALVADGDKPAARMHPLVDLRGATGLMERAGFRRQVVDSYPLKVRFSSLSRVISDLRDHGLTSSLASPAPPLDRNWISRAEAEFDRLRDKDGKVEETFEILVLTGWH